LLAVLCDVIFECNEARWDYLYVGDHLPVSLAYFAIRPIDRDASSEFREASYVGLIRGISVDSGSDLSRPITHRWSRVDAVIFGLAIKLKNTASDGLFVFFFLIRRLAKIPSLCSSTNPKDSRVVGLQKSICKQSADMPTYPITQSIGHGWYVTIITKCVKPFRVTS
jgi:hypothetical protein